MARVSKEEWLDDGDYIYIYIYIYIYMMIAPSWQIVADSWFSKTRRKKHLRIRGLKWQKRVQHEYHTLTDCDYTLETSRGQIRNHKYRFSQSAGAVEYTDWPPPHPDECPRYDTKQSDGEVLLMLEFWGMRSTPSLPSLLGPLYLGVVEPDRALCMG